MVDIRIMEEADIDRLIATFAIWHKERSQYERYWKLQQAGNRVVFVACDGETVAGYTTIIWETQYRHFRAAGIPEIVDLNVIDSYQNRGIGTRLIEACEDEARRQERTMIGISVVQSPEYEKANRLYPKLGYLPDEHGITPYDNALHLVKQLR